MICWDHIESLETKKLVIMLDVLSLFLFYFLSCSLYLNLSKYVSLSPSLYMHLSLLL